jgi:glutamyl-tRNA reductase
MDAIRAEEIERIRTHLDSMTPEQRNAVDHLARRLVAKILHSPLARSREFAATNQGQMYLTALKELFQLDDED